MYIMYINIKSVPKLSKYHSNPIYLSNMVVMNDNHDEINFWPLINSRATFYLLELFLH